MSVYLKDLKNSLSQEVSILFGKTDFVHKNIKIVERIKTELEAHTIKYKVNTLIEYISYQKGIVRVPLLSIQLL